MKSKIEISTNKEFKQLMLKYSTVNIQEFNVNINLLRGFAARDIELIGKYEGYEYIIFGFDNYKTYNTDYYEDINTFIKEVGEYEIYNLFENLTFDWIDGASWFSKVQRIEWEKGTPKKIIEKIDEDNIDFDEFASKLWNECREGYYDEGDLSYDEEDLDFITSIEISFKYNGDIVKFDWFNPNFS